MRFYNVMALGEWIVEASIREYVWYYKQYKYYNSGKLEEIRSFFRSDWFDILVSGSIDGEELIEQLDSNLGDKPYKRVSELAGKPPKSKCGVASEEELREIGEYLKTHTYKDGMIHFRRSMYMMKKARKEYGDEKDKKVKG